MAENPDLLGFSLASVEAPHDVPHERVSGSHLTVEVDFLIMGQILRI